MADMLTPAPIAQAPGMPQAGMPSSLAAAFMHGGGAPNIQAPNIPLASLMPLLMQQDQNGQSLGSKLWNGLGNWMSGYQFDGMPGSSMMSNLTNQAQANVAGGAAGL